MLIERVLEAVLIVVAIRTGMTAVGLSTEGGGRATWQWISRRRTPIAAIVVTSLLVMGAVLQLCWPAALTTLSRSVAGGHRWQVLTAPFVQDGGVAGTVLNIVSAAVVLALAEWIWGPVTTAVIWLVGAWAPVGAVVGLVGYHVPTHDVGAYSAGSSGATYFTAGSICAAFFLSRTGRMRWLGLVGPVIALVMWLVTDDGHGVLLTAGFAGALLLGGLCLILRHRTTMSVRCQTSCIPVVQP